MTGQGVTERRSTEGHMTAPAASLPATALVRRIDTHRLIPSQAADGGAGVLARLADDAGDLGAIVDLAWATDDRRLAEGDRLPGIGIAELLFGLPHDRIVNGAFAHAHPFGRRYEGPDRGAWVCAFEPATARAEAVFHHTVALAEVGRFDDVMTCDDWLADVSAELHDIRDGAPFADCLAPDSYGASQDLARGLMAAGSLGVIHPSVRQPGGTRLALFRPALVMNVRKAATWRFTWSGEPTPTVMVATT